MVISISNDRDQFYIHHISYTFVSIYSYTYTHMTQHLQPIKPPPIPKHHSMRSQNSRHPLHVPRACNQVSPHPSPSTMSLQLRKPFLHRELAVK